MAVGRRQARRQALFVLYQWDVTGQPLASLFEGEVDPVGEVAGRGGRRESGELDVGSRRPRRAGRPTASAPSSGTPSGSQSTSSTPATSAQEVAINEAVALARRYATDEAGKLVNGILGRIQREMTEAM